MQTILLVEDDIHITKINKQMISREGYAVLTASTAKKCIEIVKNNHIDLIVLDINLPDANGIVLCQKIKDYKSIPIIFLSAMNDNNDIIKGLDAGGDDYVTKPYDLSVLLARIKVRLRNETISVQRIEIEDLILEFMSASVKYKNIDMLFTKREFLILWQLVLKKDELISRETLYTKVWGTPHIDNYNALRVLISRVNKKLLDVGSSVKILSRRQQGYVLTIDENEE